MKKILVILICFIFISCKEETPDRAVVVNKLQSSAKLATVEYIITKVVSAKEKSIVFKDASFFAESEATIKAGIDLNKLKEDDIKIDGKKINLTLPAIELINFSYPVEAFKIKSEFTNNPLFSINKIDLPKRDELYRQSESSIRANIENLGITKTAQENTRKLMTGILRNAGFNEIYIQFKESKKIVSDSVATTDAVK